MMQPPYEDIVSFLKKWPEVFPKPQDERVYDLIACSVTATYIHETFNKTVEELYDDLISILSKLPEKEATIPLAKAAFVHLAFKTEEWEAFLHKMGTYIR